MLNCFHPFEFNRAELALKRLEEAFGSKLQGRVVRPQAPVSFEDLALVHEADYLKSLERNLPVTQVIEVPWLSVFPRSCIENWFIDPALWSVAGSLLAARTALEEGGCLSLGGGFHHAKRTGGEGFCLFSDIAYVIETLRGEGAIAGGDGILYVDLDVHQGNGVSVDYQDDRCVKILDCYNRSTYPVWGGEPQGRVDVPIPVYPRATDEDYLRSVEAGLEKLEDLSAGCRLLIYNAGTDVYQDDKLGGLRLTREGVNRRDLLILNFARKLHLPMLALASGGYSTMSATLLADFATAVLHSEV
jgi:histone deacetylase 11